MDEEVEERGLDGILAPPRGGGAIAPFFGGGDGGGGGGIFPGGLFPRIFPGFPGFGYPEQFGHPVSDRIGSLSTLSSQPVFFSAESWRPGSSFGKLLLRLLHDTQSDPVARRQCGGAQQRQGVGRHRARHCHQVRNKFEPVNKCKMEPSTKAN